MRTRTLCWYGTVIAVCGLVGAAATGQPPPAGTGVAPPLPLPAPEDPRTVPPQAPPKPPTVDQLIDRLAELRKQKEELDRQEQSVVKGLRERLAQQTERLRKLGVIDEPPVKAEAGVG